VRGRVWLFYECRVGRGAGGRDMCILELGLGVEFGVGVGFGYGEWVSGRVSWEIEEGGE
jgi:hypothetical protein